MSAQPFLELLKEDPGRNANLWDRQLMALNILERLDKTLDKTLNKTMDEEFKLRLLQHPSSRIRQWFKERRVQADREVITAERGGYQLVRIPGGVFQMGSPESEEGRWEEEGPVHDVHISSFYMGVYPVTNEEYGQFLKENPDQPVPEYWADPRFNRPRQPVVGVLG